MNIDVTGFNTLLSSAVTSTFADFSTVISLAVAIPLTFYVIYMIVGVFKKPQEQEINVQD
jgi:ABC-type Na+ efflux pump permease subunit